MTRILFAAGGTGGHVFPALAVAQAMMSIDPSLKISFVGRAYGLEFQIFQKSNWDYHAIDVQFLKGLSLWQQLKRTVLLGKTGWQAHKLLRKLKPQLVIGSGGFVSGPITALAALQTIPTAVLEQNAIPGLTNRLLMPWVDKIFVSFDLDQSTYDWPTHKTLALGNPIRTQFLNVVPHFNVDLSQDIHVLVLGGSQGAQSLNHHLPAIFDEIQREWGRSPRLKILHQCGKNRSEQIKTLYENSSVQVEVKDFIADMKNAYAWAHWIISRAGATTLAEIQAMGKPSILIPFPHAAHDHQTQNALAMAQAGASIWIPDRDLEDQRSIARQWAPILRDTEMSQKMAKAAFQMAKPRAAFDVAHACLNLIDSKI